MTGPRQEDSALDLNMTERGMSLAEQIYLSLRQAIITNKIAAGTRLREVELAEMLGASRTPLREAVSRLSGDGLVLRLPKGGVEVVDLMSERDDIHEIHVSLECTAARLAAQRILPEELDVIYQLVDERDAMPISAVRERSVNNTAFHECIRSASHSPRLVKLIGDYREFFLDAERIGLLDEEESRRAAVEHRQIADALRDGDAERADRVLRTHIVLAYRSIKRAAPRQGGSGA